MYRGMFPALLGILPYAGLAFYTFQTLKKVGGGLHGMSPVYLACKPYLFTSPVGIRSCQQVVVRFTGEEPAAWQRLLCGGAAGFVGQTGVGYFRPSLFARFIHPCVVVFLHMMHCMLSRVCCWFVSAVTYPLDVVRRRMQTERFILHQLQGRGWTADPTNSAVNMSQASRVVVEDSGSTIREVWRSVVAKEGWRGLFKGLTLNWIKGPLSVGISLTLFDITKGMLH